MFNGRNIMPNSLEDLTKVVNFLNGKADVGEFEFSEKPSYWAKHEGIIKPLGLGHDGAGYYFAVSLAFIAVKKRWWNCLCRKGLCVEMGMVVPSCCRHSRMES